MGLSLSPRVGKEAFWELPASSPHAALSGRASHLFAPFLSSNHSKTETGFQGKAPHVMGS